MVKQRAQKICFLHIFDFFNLYTYYIAICKLNVVFTVFVKKCRCFLSLEFSFELIPDLQIAGFVRVTSLFSRYLNIVVTGKFREFIFLKLFAATYLMQTFMLYVFHKCPQITKFKNFSFQLH